MRRYLDRNDTIGEIRQIRRHPDGKHYLWVLVEGQSDQKLYAKLLDGGNTKVEMVNGGGKNEVREALIMLTQETNQVIGICDADFLHLDNRQETIDVLFLTDVHDAELMLMACDVAFQQLVAEYLPAQLDTFAMFRVNLLKSLVFFSALRWLNDIGDLGLNFDGIGLAKFYNAGDFYLDKQKCLAEITTRSPRRKGLPDIPEIEEKTSAVTDLYILSNGHDVLKAFALHVTTKTSKGVSDDEMGKALRIAYRKADFASTALCNSLKQWERSSGFTLFAD